MQNTNSNANIYTSNENNKQSQIKTEQNINQNRNEKGSLPELNQSINNFNNEETNVENLLKLIKDQTSELKKNKKRLEKLEEAFKKTNNDLKLINSDKTSFESFLKIIFPKEMHVKVIRIENGSYNSSELSKFWLVCESKNQNEFQKILNQLKNENSDYTEKNKKLQIEFDNKIKELKKIKNDFDFLSKEYAENKDKYQEKFSKYNVLECEKNFLMTLVDEKNNVIESLRALEVENAELKAKSLLDNISSVNPVRNKGNSNVKSNSQINDAVNENENKEIKKNKIGDLNSNTSSFAFSRSNNFLKICKLFNNFC